MFVCNCRGVTESEIVQAIELGANTMPSLKCGLDVANCCGQCEKDVADLLQANQPCIT